MPRNKPSRNTGEPKPPPPPPPPPTSPLPPEPPAQEPKTPKDLDNELHEILFGYARDAETSLARARTRLRTEVLPVLGKHQVANIEAAYSGYGDSGAIDGTQYRDAAGHRVERTTLPQKTIEALEECLYEFLPEGFETDDGGQGTLTLDVPTGRLSLRHQENYTATSESSREWHV